MPLSAPPAAPHESPYFKYTLGVILYSIVAANRVFLGEFFLTGFTLCLRAEGVVLYRLYEIYGYTNKIEFYSEAVIPLSLLTR